MSLKDDCDCGHDRTSQHYFDPITQTYCNCLAFRCECKAARKPGESKAELPPRPDHHPPWCACYWCKQHPRPVDEDEIDEDPPPSTDPYPSLFYPFKFP